MAVVLVSADLMGASRIETAARSAGVPYQMVGSVEAAVAAAVAAPTSLVILDLTTAGIDAAELVQRLKPPSANQPTVVAFGPHVHEATLQDAKAAGCDEVLARGQLLSQIETLIARFGNNRD